MNSNPDILNFNNTSSPNFARMLRIVIRLSIPAIIAQLTTVVMQYIDAAMVGSLGAGASAAIGLVSTSTWLLGGLCSSLATGFSVQIAQLVGAQRTNDAKNVFRQSLIVSLLFGVFLSVIGALISGTLPLWLGGDEAICGDASAYFFIFALTLPASQIRQTVSSSLQCSGDMKTPSFLNVLMCFLDVIFNFFFIYPTRDILLGTVSFRVYGAGLGVVGAALGTAMADYVVAVIMLAYTALKSDKLALERGGSWRLHQKCIATALKISVPTAFEHVIMCSAYICATLIIAPLGMVAVAANSLAVTAESLCYMPGYGIGRAATTVIGQSLGAGNQTLAKRFARVSNFLGVSVMTAMAVLMYAFAPNLFSILSSSYEVRELGADILRIVAFAEPLYAASIVCTGVLRGAGDTLIPAVLSLVSMWGVRITLSLVLVPSFGLHGVWLAMAAELCVRGILFIARVYRGRWLGKKVI